ncbi:ferredoxin [Amycolatopsis methanolica]|uniref:Ferredoxin n=1 Tax=Amycolatopsis methanolica 239 TaxID=1068978 RepID=A0A076MWC1_AMYME|nr:ferredoxin [Amycolatopsis methanolica]AIJ25054.1 ferredoxin [Amycolatopsis methanolica 239]
MEVAVDRSLCEANEVCIGFAPAVFELNDDEELRIAHPSVPESEVERVSQAIAACPKNALFIVE